MSLDVYLISDKPIKKAYGSGIFIRENGTTKEVSEKEWRARFPDREPVRLAPSDGETNELYHGNITHNLAQMAAMAGLYECFPAFLFLLCHRL